MKRRSRSLFAGLAAAAAVLSCDEGRLLTDVERQPLKVEVSAPAGPATLLVGEAGTYTASVQADGTVLDPGILTFHWSVAPPGLLAVDTSDQDATITVSGISPGTATLTARAVHPDIQEHENSVQVRVLLQGVAPLTPLSGDTTLAAVGDAFTARARGFGKNNVSARTSGLSWTHRGSALSVGTTLTGADSLRVTAVKAGTDTLVFNAPEEVCASGSCTDTILVRVVPVPVEIEVVTNDTVNALGDTTALVARGLDSNGNPIPDLKFAWSTETPDILELLPSGDRVRSLATGEGRVTATHGEVTATGTILSRQVAAVVTLSPATAPDTLLAGDTLRFTAEVADSNGVAIPGRLTWSTDDPEVASVDDMGKVAGQPVIALDSTPVVATFSPAADTVWVFVEPAVLSAVVVAPDSIRLTAIGGTAQLAGDGVNQNGDPMPGETVTWTTRDSGVATVDGTGNVTGVAVGSTYVVATSSSDSTLTDSAKVVVEQVVASVVVSPGSHTFNALSATQQFSATALDSKGESIPGKSFTWIDDADSPGVVSVDGSGLVTARQAGTSRVIATTDGMTGSADVTVQQLPAAISISPAVDTVAAGGTTSLTATVLDSSGHTIPGAPVSWSSLNTSFATVSATGVVTGGTVIDSVAMIQAIPTGEDYAAIRDTSRIRVVSSYVLGFAGNDYGDAGDVLALGTAWTIEAWVKPENTSGIQYLLARGGSSASGAGSYGLYLNSGKPAVFIRSGPGGNVNKQNDLVSATTLSTTAWSHVAVSYDGTELRMYINGVATDAMPSTNTPQTAADSLIFGASDATGANPLMGRLDEVRFWSTVRTEAEIAGAYQSTLSGDEAGLLAWWPFSAGAGDPVDGKAGLTLTLPPDPNDPAWTAEYPKIP